MEAMRSRLCMAAVLFAVIAFTGSCSNLVFGNIPPSTFRFVTVLKHEGPEPGGWQVAQVVVMLGRLSTMFPRSALCNVEVGTPIVNTQNGYISVELAQEESAKAADATARELLQQHERPVASICIDFREKMTDRLGHATKGSIPGSKVSGFRTWQRKKIPRRTFPRRRR